MQASLQVSRNLFLNPEKNCNEPKLLLRVFRVSTWEDARWKTKCVFLFLGVSPFHDSSLQMQY